jgi:hypothetical protein
MEANAKTKKNVADPSTVPTIASEGEQSAALVLTEEVAEINTLMKVSKELQSSAMFPALKNSGQVLAIILAGRERGYGPMTSLTNIHIINGRPGYSGQLIAAELKKADVTFDVLESDVEHCKIQFNRADRKPFTYEWTVEDAQRANKLPADKASVWSTYPQDMLYWRCLTAGARRFAPDAIMGVYLRDELSDVRIDVSPEATAAENDRPPIDPDDMTPGAPDKHQGYDEPTAEPEPLEETARKDLMDNSKDRLVAMATDELAQGFSDTDAGSKFISDCVHGRVLGDSDFNRCNKGQLANFILSLRSYVKSAGKQEELIK